MAASNRAGSGQRPERARTRLRKGDTVLVTAGKDRGKTGKVLKMIAEKNRATVERLNMIKRHTKGNPQMGQPGGIIEKEAPIHISNLKIWNALAEKGDRIGFKILEDGRKVRVFKSNNEVVDA